MVLFNEYKENVALKGEVYGTEGTNYKDRSHDYHAIFDGDWFTSFDYPEPSGGWATVDLGKSIKIDSMTYCPRNRDNYVRPGIFMNSFIEVLLPPNGFHWENRLHKPMFCVIEYRKEHYCILRTIRAVKMSGHLNTIILQCVRFFISFVTFSAFLRNNRGGEMEF